MAKKKNWDQIRNQRATDTVKYRDVYEDQQLERGSIAEKQTMLGRGIICGVISFMAFWLVWLIISGVNMMSTGKGEREMSQDPSQVWFYVEEHYEHVDNPEDIITVDELYALQDEWRLNYNPNIPVVNEPVYPENPDEKYPDGRDAAGREMPMESLRADYQQKVAQYEKDLKDYEAYCEAMYDPEYRGDDPSKYNPNIKDTVPNENGRYFYVRAHYKNRYDLGQFIEVSDYDKLVAKFNGMKLTNDEADLPVEPMNPADLYRVVIPYDESTDEFGEGADDSGEGANGGNISNGYPYECPAFKGSERLVLFFDSTGRYHQHQAPTGIVYDNGDWFDKDDNVMHVTSVDGNVISIGAANNDANEGDEEGFEEDYSDYTYRNVFDARTIDYDTYNAMCDEYAESIDEYWEKYWTHRETFHPDDVDGTKKIFTMAPTVWKVLISLAVAGILFGIMYALFKKNLDAQNLLSDTSDINQYHNDQHVALPEEVQRNYDWFPDVGAHSGVSVSSMISHMALTNKGLKQVEFAKRADKDILDENGDVEYYKGEILMDENGEPITSMKPIIDEEFMDALFDASGAPKDKNVRKKYDTTKIPYNPDGSNRDKLGKYETVADLINDDWEYPIYEPQRPGGAYIVDTAPVNTMVLAITRAGKGQTVIEPTLDMWMREKRPNNMVVNDPKGELLVKNYVRATVRGLQVVQFNLINAMKTDIYNPLAMAADAAREGDNTKCAMYVENIAEVFFPLDGGDDPVWPNAANNAFKRAAYGLIDFYLEEEKAMRRMAERTHIDDKVLEQKIDEMWGKVTLYNCYQLFVQLSSKKMKNPAVEFSNQAKAGKFNDLSDEEYEIELNKVKNKSKLWEDKPDADLLTLYFAATDALPKNSMRTLVSNANNALKSMGGAEKMMASVYGIAITAMSFFTDPTISTLTSGTLNQNVDLGSLSFPRRAGVRFNSDYIKKYHFVGLQCVWNAYEDIGFEKCLGKDFYHEDMVTREGWARYFFDGKFKNETAYLKLEIKNPSSGILVRTFFFEFKKNYQTSLDGRVYMKDPVLEEKIVKNGIITELRKFKKKDGTIVYRKAKTTFKQQKILDFKKKGEKTEVNTNAIISTMCRYAEKPKMVFLVTPPHLMKYAKLILILIKQLVDLNFDKSYMTKSNQKPLYKTRFMLDELGNLQSEGHGISGFETMLSIGLGQEQQFTLILQTLQQLKDVYGVMILSTNRVAAYS